MSTHINERWQGVKYLFGLCFYKLCHLLHPVQQPRGLRSKTLHLMQHKKALHILAYAAQNLKAVALKTDEVSQKTFLLCLGQIGSY